MSDSSMSDDAVREPNRTPECESLVDARLADYLDDAPDPALVAAVDAHAARCSRCAALVADLRGITVAAQALPPLRPSRDLWSGIAERIAAPAVAAPESRPSAVGSIAEARRRSRALSARWRPLLAAAAALVFVTAGVTYQLTKSTLQQTASVDAPRPSVTTVASTPTVARVASPARLDSADGVDAGPATKTRPATTVGLGGPRFRNVNGERRPAVTAKPAYDVQIDALRKIVRERRAELDPATLAVLEKNIAVIDQAIAQSRAALAHDPRSRFLDEQLHDALDKKLDLLRTAALLPART